MFKSRFFIAQFILIIALFTMSFKPVSADVGTHLGEGDITTQINIMDNVIGQQGGNFPVTIMVDMGTSAQDLAKLASTASNNGLVPIVRINKVCDASATESSEMVSRIRSNAAFGPNVIITFGNEVNNKDAECSDWSTYATNYRAVAGGNISPSALDWYMGLADYNAKKFQGDSGLTGEYNSAPIRTANAYGCIGLTSESCDITNPDHIGTINTGMQGTSGKTLYLTEFSLSPGGSDPPDRNLQNVVDFIKAEAGSTGATHVTPLVRNVCANLQNEGQWLIYVNGNLFTVHGTAVALDCTAISGSSGSVVPAIPQDPNRYFLYPLNMNKDATLAWNMVYDQGYQVHCPSSNAKIQKKTLGALKRYVELNGGFDEKGTAQTRINLANATIPLFRGPEHESTTQKTSSFEGFFSAINHYHEDNGVIYSGVVENLMTQEQQCQTKKNNLLTMQDLCGTLKDINLCALNKDIPDAFDASGKQYNAWALLGDFLDLLHNKGISCKKLTTGEYEESDRAQAEAVADAFTKLPLNLDLAWRNAYIVVSPLQDEDEGPQDQFWFLDSKADLNKEQFAPLFISLKIPDFTTNRTYSAGKADAAKITANFLRPSEQNIEQEEDELTRRVNLLASVETAEQKRLAGTKPEVIDCRDMPQCTEESETIPLELRTTLLDIINGNGTKCDSASPDSLRELAGDLGTPAATSEDESRELQDHFISGIIPNNQTKTFNWGVRVHNIGEASNPYGDNEDIKVRVHLIAPIGSDLEDITNVLNTFFGFQEMDTIIENNCLIDAGGKCGVIPEYYPIANSSLGSGGSIKKKFYDPKLPCPEDEANGSRNYPDRHCLNNDFELKLKDREPGLYIMGARLGWIIRKIQEVLRPMGSKARQYLATCQRTEDLFLGRCGGGPTNSSTPNNATSEQCQDYRNQTVDIPEYKSDGSGEVGKMICDVAQEYSDIMKGEISKAHLAQFLWGALQVDGREFLVPARQGQTQMSCGDLIKNSCGASQILGVIVSPCATSECPQVQNFTPPSFHDACSLRGQLEWSARKIQMERSFVKSLLPSKEEWERNNSVSYDDQIMYMHAGRHAGVAQQYLKQPACGGVMKIPGCPDDPNNPGDPVGYCGCVMDGNSDLFSFSCN